MARVVVTLVTLVPKLPRRVTLWELISERHQRHPVDERGQRWT